MRNRSRLTAVALLATITVVSGAGGAAAQIGLLPVWTSPGTITAVESAADGSGRLFVAVQTGQIYVLAGGQPLPTPFLDIGPLVSNFSERGLLGLAFHPDYTSNGTFFVNYTDLSGDTVIARYAVSANPDIADPASGTLVLAFDQPGSNHNGGDLAFGPDGFLYIATGDGGAGIGDPLNNAQNLSAPLGKILRIDVDGAAPYTIPPGNPFAGTPGAFEEIWAYGLRNPWRISFDSLSGDLYVADVGELDFEEVDFQAAGAPGGQNYGWRRMEAGSCFQPSTGCNDGSLTLPVVEYDHSAGDCSITGGHVYRGDPLSPLFGSYLYADLCTGRIWAASHSGGTWTTQLLLDSNVTPTTFGRDQSGELYLGTTNALYRIAIPPPACEVAMTQASYSPGDIVEIATLRYSNLAPAVLPTRLRLQLDIPIPLVIDLLDLPLTIPGGFDNDLGPISMFAARGLPLGSWSLRCAFEDPVSGAVQAEDEAFFGVDP